jgi:predicted permease
VLVTASLVAVRGLVRSVRSNFGFDPKYTLLLNTDLTMARYTGEQVPIVQRRMVDAALAIPGVTAAAYANTVPLNLDQLHSTVFSDGATDLRESNAIAQILQLAVSPGYFDAARTTLLAGRSFTWHDDRNAPRVAVVNREFARQVFGSIQRAIGGHFTNTEARRIEVVGVVEDGKYEGLTEDPKSVIYYANLQSPSPNMWLVVRSDRDPGQLTAAALNRAMRALDPGLPFTIRTWEKELGNVLFPARVANVSLGVLGALGAMLALTGIFVMAAYSVSKRLREFGIRIALGGQRKELLSAALGRVFRLLVFGSAAGLLLGMAAGKVLAFIVFQATPRDPIVLGGVLLTMTLVGVLAAWIPARRALATDPSILLREE